MNDLFGGVVYAGIDTDRYKYPIGSGRVTFGNQKSFMKAVKAGFVEIKTGKFTKKVNLKVTLGQLTSLYLYTCIYIYIIYTHVIECSCLATRLDGRCLSVFIAPERVCAICYLFPDPGSD